MDDTMATTERLILRLMRGADADPLAPIAGTEWVQATIGLGELRPWTIVDRRSATVYGFCGFFVRPIQGTTLGYGIHPSLQTRREGARRRANLAE